MTATALRALSGNRPAVIDGKANALIAFLFGTLLPRRVALAIARRVMTARSGGRASAPAKQPCPSRPAQRGKTDVPAWDDPQGPTRGTPVIRKGFEEYVLGLS